MKYLHAIKKQSGRGPGIIGMPLFPGEMKGRDQLSRYAGLLAEQPGFSTIGAEVKGHG